MKKFYFLLLALITGFTAGADNAALKKQIVGSYTGSSKAYEYFSNSDGTYTTINYTEASPLVIEALGGDSVVIKNLMSTEMAPYSTDIKVIGTVVADDSYAGYLGYITIEPQVCGQVLYYGENYDAYIGYELTDSNNWLSSSATLSNLYFYIKDDYTIWEDYYGFFLQVPSWGTDYYLMFYGNMNYNAHYTKFSSLTTDIKTVKAKDEALDPNAPVEYYNLQGVRVSNPENGIYIRRQGNKATKVVIK
jgi:hypothetical protein